ncbi:NAD(+) diphosphatase [Lichenihabitans psoromatis]|uniref:NAD(+) diphosphatase n=1 Tax=Lichenihabitans psoromatis TaxID=2528642 RepID=UPI00103855AB|nr:NAD(+) diphosphatase [Lichenihabitans psoromatis]
MTDCIRTTAAFGASLGFIDNPLDRMSGRRDNPEEVASFRAAPQTVSLVLAGDSVVLGHQDSPWFGLAVAEAMGSVQHSTFLGERNGQAYFATALMPDAAEHLAERSDVQIIDLRSIATRGLVSNDDLGALAQAKAVTHWHRQHRFCSNCGTPTEVAGAGWRRECPACGTHHFPRTDPVVIMLAVDGERCLLGRQARFPERMYSCLAGFLEPGETFEDAVRRELHEEAGITTGYVAYLGSQPWPFPASIMLGCVAQAIETDITIDTTELEDARWFTREETRAMLEGRHEGGLTCPPPMAIAHHIMRAWAIEGVTPRAPSV